MRFDTPYNQRPTPPNRAGQQSVDSAATSSAHKWNSWWSRRSPNLPTNANPPVRVGIDAGSKTIKLVALDEHGEIVYALYHRHRSNVLSTLAELLHEAIWRYGDITAPVAITGSAGIALADALGLPFVQEVIATTKAVKTRFPQANCIIELGGEDAKVIYLDNPIEQRMNATCAGGTGDLIDGISSMLGLRTREISRTALGHLRTYPIASRCAVFAQTDVRPLINAGARKSDIAQSALEAVVQQTLGGLACGRPIRGNVVFLGGPLEHIPALVLAFRKKLGLTNKTGIKPADAHLFTAAGAIMAADDSAAASLAELERKARRIEHLPDDGEHLAPLFQNTRELEEFQTRHAKERVVRKPLDNVKGPLYLGFDAGSTTVKYALVDKEGALVASDYRESQGDTFKTAKAMLDELLARVYSNRYSRNERYIAHATVTGYGEDLLRAGFGFDSGVVETVAHLRAAQHFRPDVSFVLDIGGQDMKALWLHDGHVVDAVLNEACSSGCGAFIQSTAKSLRVTQDTFSKLALDAENPIDLGAKCTVFMTSRVRHAQKTGANAGDIAAGIAYSVVNNAMTRIIGKNHTASLGNAVVVQGGAFKSDAVLRAFELVCGVDAIRADAAHLMGAYGAALIARDAGDGHSELVSASACAALEPATLSMRCPGCGNSCLLSVVDFGSGKRHMSGNRCERAVHELFDEPECDNQMAPNVVLHLQRRIAAYGSATGHDSRCNVTVGLMNTLEMHEYTPFWHTLLSTLGFSLIVPDDADAESVKDRASETIPSESVCYPAKLSHLRYAHLIDAGASFVFMPQFERERRCPVTTQYAHVLRCNVESPQLVSPLLREMDARAICRCEDDRIALLDALNSLLDAHACIEYPELARALDAALEAQEAFERDVAHAAQRALAWTAEDPRRRAAVLAGRPYHADPTLLHRIDEELTRIGFAVIPAFGMHGQKLFGTRNTAADVAHAAAGSLWEHGAQLARLVEVCAENPQVEVIGLRSFGCGYDAVSFDAAHDLAAMLQRPFTELKIDDIVDTAHIRIRLRTLAHTCGLGRDYKRSARAGKGSTRGMRTACATPDLCSTAKAQIEHAVAELDASPELDERVIDDVCKDCLTAALPFELAHMRPDREIPHVIAAPVGGDPSTPPPIGGSAQDDKPGARDAMKVGLLGNPLLVFDEEQNEHIADLLRRLGCQVIYPRPELIAVEDVRYLDQLDVFQTMGVERVIYLQSFGCLKGHVHARGSLRELARRYPSMPITVIDYDPESSALNRENRIRLAVTRATDTLPRNGTP